MADAWWEMSYSIEPNDVDLEHIASSIKEGYTSGEIIQEKKSGWWDLNFANLEKGDTEDIDLERVANLVKEGYTSGEADILDEKVELPKYRNLPDVKGIRLYKSNKKGWHKEPINHALASKGIKVGKNRAKR